MLSASDTRKDGRIHRCPPPLSNEWLLSSAFKQAADHNNGGEDSCFGHDRRRWNLQHHHRSDREFINWIRGQLNQRGRLRCGFLHLYVVVWRLGARVPVFRGDQES